jgi:hypothetical protein
METELNDMATDVVLDYFTNELTEACQYLGNALDQADVTLVQILRIQNILNDMNAVLMKNVPRAKL